MILFTEIVFMQIDIEGFVVAEDKYVGETYMNRPVVAISQIECDENTIILVSDEVSREQISILPKDKIVYWSGALGFNENLKNERVIIYGTGYGAIQIEELLDGIGTETELYCVTKRKEGVCHKGKQVIEASELYSYEEYSIIVSVIAEMDKNEILEMLRNFPGKIYLRHIFDATVIPQISLIQSIDLAIRKGREIYLYGRNKAVASMVETALSIYNIKINEYVSDLGLYSLGMEDVENKVVIICDVLPECFVRDRQNVELAGFTLEQHNYTGLVYYTASDEKLLGILNGNHDPLVGYSISYEHGKPGWQIYGNEEKESIKILITGGSTSSEVYHPENWVSKLYYKLKQQNIKITIYNGAHTGDDIVDEILRLLRDTFVLRPQIIISMSGVNDTKDKAGSNQFNPHRLVDMMKSFVRNGEYCSGVYDNETLYSFWNRNVGLIELIANFYGAIPFCFLQPMNIVMQDMDVWEKSIYEMESHMVGSKEFAEFSNKESKYINLMQLFEHQNEMYMDMAHYTNKAHEIIADQVYKYIKPTIQQIV